MANGVVKTVTDRGFGFISMEGSDKDIFYHEKSLEGDLAVRKLQVGDKVTFDVEETPKGQNAMNIKLVE
ncbi:cold-shock protein [Candidatus Dojkabacteria bacterium CG_4_10_14_0_2_um_filter_Dojkabacteria_WS6_41_15]|uniref:Cold-shock protein n=1 Tax=Candidatus Dojkabacteria bacterium CG_4_10_14_0_2_um_filter_Dojkabacteria_WS6_41_15 TaxID=2014249 RepID=A0A2M7W1V8_9BACT|nr:MAG: cold-shock protein [Candidatus Dojkabacteria bacterium CG_4_10_14_0_2_um_filter_Dojkabacteria_WS6_41_15]